MIGLCCAICNAYIAGETSLSKRRLTQMLFAEFLVVWTKMFLMATDCANGLTQSDCFITRRGNEMQNKNILLL